MIDIIKNFMHLIKNCFIFIKKESKYASDLRRWCKENPGAKTFIMQTGHRVPFEKINVGRFSYGPLMVYSYSSDSGSLRIGSFCSIANGVEFLLGGNHEYHNLSTYPFKAKMYGVEEALTKGDIIVEDDVWIGANSMILSGVTLRQGTIVAAGSVVTSSSLPYSIIGGNPAKLIKKRFDDELITKLTKFDFSKLDEGKIKENLDALYTPVTMQSVNEIISLIGY